MENEAYYFNLIDWLMGFNTLPVIGFSIVCFIWVGIVRTQSKKLIFTGAGSVLVLFTIVRVIVIALPTNFLLLILVGALHGIMMGVMFGVFVMVTSVVKKRNREYHLAEQCRQDALECPIVQQWETLETDLYDFGREAGWIK